MENESILIYDLEIKNAILGRGESRKQGISYCGGWGDHKNMGVSVLTAFDYKEDRLKVFTDENKHEFKELVENTDVIVGFNQINFDNKVVRECWGIDIPVEKNFDILREIYKALGGRKAGYGLEPICKANLGTGKSGDGAMAPIWWQEGKIEKLTDYCIVDTEQTKRIFELIRTNKALVDPKNPSRSFNIEYNR